MTSDITKDKQFQDLAKEYKFLHRAKGENLESLEFTILDIETTGLEPADSEITEIGAFKVKGKEIQDLFSSLIKTYYPISQKITELTGINDAMVKDSPPAKEVLPRFIEFIGDSILIAHNADFDINFIKYHLKKLNQPEMNNRVVCTVKLARYLLPNLRNHKLHTVAAHFGLKAENRHRAVGDAELTYQIWTHFIDMLKERGISNKRDLDSLAARL
ncbi:MAG: exonuclease domain-containing protein [Candidatus Margulisiibacteriota bacterium]|nr:exonuclease domain-containing protein [Candidatus Margulisiibacteriota bacterium]